jgi:hypothetical protein
MSHRFDWRIGHWENGRFVESKPKKIDNRRIRLRGKRGLIPVKHLYFSPKKGWQPIPF